jgi:hypothetical protein
MSVDNRPTLTLYGKSLIAIVIIFGSVSATTMVIFCLSLTTDSLGKAIAALIGLGIVLAQYVFASKIQQDKSKGQYDVITIIVTVIIFAMSIIGTWSWLESEFNTNNKTSTQNSESYLDHRDLIAMKKITVKEHLAQAKVYRDRGGNYNGQAQKSTLAANKVQAEIQILINERNTLPTITTGNSSQDMGAALGDFRFLVWLGFALIIDLCAVIAIIELKKYSGAATVAPTESDTLTSGNAATTQPHHAEMLGEFSKQHRQFAAVVTALRSGAIKPGKNAIQKKFNLGTATVDRLFEQLVQLKVIKRTEGKRTYELINDDSTTHQTVARAT